MTATLHGRAGDPLGSLGPSDGAFRSEYERFIVPLGMEELMR